MRIKWQFSCFLSVAFEQEACFASVGNLIILTRNYLAKHERKEFGATVISPLQHVGCTDVVSGTICGYADNPLSALET